jgi:UDP-N-acetylenolpyruvoylglucosamine reductase
MLNEGGATTAEIRELMDQVRARVLSRTGVELENEVRFMG